MRSTRILLVEDDDAARYIFATVLSHAGYAVSEASNADEAFRHLDRTVPDAVLVDLGLPVPPPLLLRTLDELLAVPLSLPSVSPRAAG